MTYRARREKVYDIQCTILGYTEKGVHVALDEDREEWLPKSKIEIEEGPKDTLGKDVVTVPEWLVEEKGLENYVEQ